MVAAAPSSSPLSPEQMEAIREELAEGPSERDLELFEQVCQRGVSQREAAAMFQLSQSQVCKVLQQMRAWAARHAPDPRSEFTPRERRRLAEYVYRERLKFFYREALHAWRASQGDHTTIRNIRESYDSPRMVSITAHSAGKPTYLMLAVRIAEKEDCWMALPPRVARKSRNHSPRQTRRP